MMLTNPISATLAEIVEHLQPCALRHVDEKAPARLVRAAQLIRQSRVQLHDAHRATVYGTTRAYDLDGYRLHLPCQPEGLDPLVRTRRYGEVSPHPGGTHAAQPLVAARPRHD